MADEVNDTPETPVVEPNEEHVQDIATDAPETESLDHIAAEEEQVIVPEQEEVPARHQFPATGTRGQWNGRNTILLREALQRRAEQEPAYQDNELLSTHQWNFLASIELERSLPTPADMGLGEGNADISLDTYMEGLIRGLNAGL